MPTSPGSASPHVGEQHGGRVVRLRVGDRLAVAAEQPARLRGVVLHRPQVRPDGVDVVVGHAPPDRRRVGEPRLHDGGVPSRVHRMDGREARGGVRRRDDRPRGGHEETPTVAVPSVCRGRDGARRRVSGGTRRGDRAGAWRAVRTGADRGVRSRPPAGQAELLEGDPFLQAVHGAPRDGPDDRRVPPRAHPEVGGREAVRVLLGVLHPDPPAEGVHVQVARDREAIPVVACHEVLDRGEEVRSARAVPGGEDDPRDLVRRLGAELGVPQCQPVPVAVGQPLGGDDARVGPEGRRDRAPRADP